MPLPLAVRLILSFSLTASAIWIWLQDPSVDYSTWVALGMTLSTVGDLFMAGLIPIGHRLIGGDDYFRACTLFLCKSIFANRHFMEWFLDWFTRIRTLSHYRMVLFLFEMRNKINCLR